MDNNNFFNGVDNLNNNPTPNTTPSAPNFVYTQQQINNDNSEINRSSSNYNSINEEELLILFIGNNYEKITTRTFNFAGFFFTTAYMFYRKIFLYAILLFILNIIVLNVTNNFAVNILFNIAVGFFVNKLYLYYAKKKIAKIKLKNPQKNIDELKGLCLIKGGTSVGQLFLGILAESVIAFVVLIVMIIVRIGNFIVNFFDFDNWNIKINGIEINTNDTSIKDSILVEDVNIGGYSCFGSNCNFSINKSNNLTEYVFKANNIDLFKLLNDYTDYIKVDIYYIEKDNKKTIVNYKIFLKSNNEELTNIKNEKELRTKIGLYTIGTYTDSFTLTKIGMMGAGFKDNTSYTYTDYTFVDSKNNEYEMTYIHSSDNINLVEGNKYNITFEVVEDTFGYGFYIKSVN